MLGKTDIVGLTFVQSVTGNSLNVKPKIGSEYKYIGFRADVFFSLFLLFYLNEISIFCIFF